MPKWEQTLPPTDLFEWLCPLGFCTGAPFDGIAPGIFITAALHGSKVIVDEKGTEAAAATAMAFDESAPSPAGLTVVADRPFLWAIVHPETGAPAVHRPPGRSDPLGEPTGVGTVIADVDPTTTRPREIVDGAGRTEIPRPVGGSQYRRASR